MGSRLVEGLIKGLWSEVSEGSGRWAQVGSQMVGEVRSASWVGVWSKEWLLGAFGTDLHEADARWCFHVCCVGTGTVGFEVWRTGGEMKEVK